ncbi:MAG: hypothetical protein ACLP8S_16610 [Solirubrobacteraceae bacterium]
MPAHQTIEPVLAPELEALAHAADQRLRADLDGTDPEIDERQQAVLQAAGAAIAAGLPLSAITQAEQLGQACARRKLGSELIRRVERTARRSREAAAEHEHAVARAARLGLAHRDIATAAQIAQIAHSAILARDSDNDNDNDSDNATQRNAADTQRLHRRAQ